VAKNKNSRGVAADGGARFKEISQAAKILTNALQRQHYDRSLDARDLFGSRRGRPPPGAAGQARNSAYTMGSQTWFYRVYRPRNLILGPLAFFGTVAAIQYVVGTAYSPQHVAQKAMLSDHSTLVQAWKNPKTGDWELPAPWDPVYRQMKPTLEYVPRENVRLRTQN